ncbi:MAG: hypothetical protein J3K34DRAFT_425989 [Monoraphidium minutum]|nr:MAG: hypothetical protein J3K34DRAFT_425989 [Monoraphidium minutum]
MLAALGFEALSCFFQSCPTMVATCWLLHKLAAALTRPAAAFNGRASGAARAPHLPPPRAAFSRPARLLLAARDSCTSEVFLLTPLMPAPLRRMPAGAPPHAAAPAPPTRIGRKKCVAATRAVGRPHLGGTAGHTPPLRISGTAISLTVLIKHFDLGFGCEAGAHPTKW